MEDKIKVVKVDREQYQKVMKKRMEINRIRAILARTRLKLLARKRRALINKKNRIQGR